MTAKSVAGGLRQKPYFKMTGNERKKWQKTPTRFREKIPVQRKKWKWSKKHVEKNI